LLSQILLPRAFHCSLSWHKAGRLVQLIPLINYERVIVDDSHEYREQGNDGANRTGWRKHSANAHAQRIPRATGIQPSNPTSPDR
jgi:hypothetical protein